MTSDALNQAVQLIRTGNKKSALPILSEIIQIDPDNEAAWIWLHVCVDSIPQKKYCLQKALAINPNNQNARNELEKLSTQKPTSATLQSIRSFAQSQPPKSEQPDGKTTDPDELLLKKFSHNVSMILRALAVVMLCLIIYFVVKSRSDLRNLEAAQTQASINHATQTQTSMDLATQTQISIIVSAQIVLERNKVVDEYLTTIEQGYMINMYIAYDHLCAKVKGQFRDPLDMYNRVIAESFHYSRPNGHTILPASDPNRVLFVLFNTERNWTAGPYEAKFEGTSLKICGVGDENGDLRYILMPGITPLDINP